MTGTSSPESVLRKFIGGPYDGCELFLHPKLNRFRVHVPEPMKATAKIEKKYSPSNDVASYCEADYVLDSDGVFVFVHPSKIFQIKICVSWNLQYVEVGRGAYLRRYRDVSDASLTRAYNALRALAGRQEQK